MESYNTNSVLTLNRRFIILIPRIVLLRFYHNRPPTLRDPLLTNENYTCYMCMIIVIMRLKSFKMRVILETMRAIPITI